MRLTAYHDSSGNIVALAASMSDDALSAEIVPSGPKPGLRTADVEMPAGVILDPGNPEELYQELDKIKESYLIDEGTLRRRS